VERKQKGPFDFCEKRKWSELSRKAKLSKKEKFGEIQKVYKKNFNVRKGSKP
jgi:hypothetical protein